MSEYNDLLDIKSQDVTFSVIDVETTGLSASYNRIIEIAVVQEKSGKIIKRFQSFVNPSVRIPYEITKLTGITDSDVSDAPSFSTLATKIADMIEGTVLCGHNLQYDLGFLTHEFRRAGIEFHPQLQLCTLRLARRMYPQLKSRSLQNLAYHLRLRGDDYHRALGDAEITAKILRKELKELAGGHLFTLRDIISYQYTPTAKISSAIQKSSIGESIGAVPRNSGVYYFINEKGKIIYIGKAKSLITRIRNYLSTNAPRKTKRIIKYAQYLRIQPTNTELTAYLYEAELIKVLNPKMNVQLKSYNDKYFMKIGKLSSYPDITITKDFNFDGNDYFGLFISKRKAEEVFELIKKIFRLRECTDKELAKRKACFLYHIDRCTGPCINDDKKIYQAEVDNVQEFMSGKSQTALNRLLQKMKRFSEELKFERAQETKELIDLVLAQIQKTSLLAEPVNRADVLFEIISPAHQCDYILFLKGQVYIKGYMVNPLRNFDTALNDYFDQTIQRAEEPDEEDLEKVKITLNWMIRNRHQVIIHYLSSHLTRQSLELRLINRLNDRSLTHNEINITLEHFLTNEVKI